jgi:hypothetical protein
MRYTTTNYADTASIGIAGVSGTPITGAGVLIDQRTTRAYFANQDGASGVTITAELRVGGVQAERDVSLVVLAGMTAITQVTVTLRYLSSDVASRTVTVSAPVQLNYAVAAFDSAGADEVVIEFDVGDTTQFSIGYLYIGELSDELTIADGALNYTVESTDPRNITRAGTPLRSASYLYAAIDMTIVEETFSTLRSRIVGIAEAGFATPRFWYFDEDCIMTGEAVYGILDSDSLQLDPRYFRKNSEAKAVTTLGIRETF